MLTPAYFNECFQKWQNRWDRCIQAQDEYFEGDSGNQDLKYSSYYEQIFGNFALALVLLLHEPIFFKYSESKSHEQSQ